MSVPGPREEAGPMTAVDASGPTALITGASRGLGAVVARFLAAEGWNLVLTARGADALAATVASIEGYRSSIRSLAGDVADPVHRSNLRRIVQELGGLDLLMNNASELGPTPLPPLTEYPLQEFEAVYRTNVAAPLGLVQELLPFLVQKHGLVVNISSDAAVRGYPGWGGYGA